MAAALNLSKPDRTIHLGVILLNRQVETLLSETEILDVAPIDLIHGMSKHFIDSMPDGFMPPELKAQALDMEFHWVSETDGPCRLTSSISMNPTDTFETCPPLDVVLMGAHHPSYTPSAAELAYIRKAYDASSAFLTICGGLMAPLQAGVLDGKTVTAPRFMLGRLRETNPSSTWLEKRWVRDGKLWTSGALLNGADMVSAFVREHWGRQEGSLAWTMADIGAWPNRDVDYRDA
ncbi:Isonitrile hydratase like protein [Verticillium longisporum]|uniref:Isonitrile hydratase like protein n=1 Tax=Verticillium longisporum TaxID=100787 RepID=A0A0G4LSK8_VERLO|nr:Isonitrile hydratase like protein [Verticillium longisporum]CRK25056.1 hypothetical protein BN1723_013468 [Verticillium longisporum]